MADEETIFEDGENLQGAIGKALHDQKALLCFVSDGGEESTRWEIALLDPSIRDKLKSNAVVLRLKAGTEQAGYLNAVCPVQAAPAVIIIFRAQVVANYQHGQTTFEQLQRQLEARYGPSMEGSQAASSTKPIIPGYIDLPRSEGRMRLPDNAYDHFRKLTQQYVSSGVSGRALLHMQLMLLDSLNIDEVTATVKSIQAQSETTTTPALPEEVTARLLNTPASNMRVNPTPNAKPPAASLPGSSSGSSSSAAQSTQSASDARSPQPRSQSQSEHEAPPPSNTKTPPSATSSQRTDYIAGQKRAEAERVRVKAQLEADRRARRDADRKAREQAEANQRRAELLELRKANSTTSNPKHTDVRIQVRLFDGSTVRSSFAAEATITQNVRPWIDREMVGKAADGTGSGAGQPYNLKLILTPLPNRQIEAGEEDSPLSDLEGVKGSATMVMVPVKGYVESYRRADGGVAGTFVGGVQSMVGTGVGLVGSAAGLFFGGFGRLMGTGTGTAGTSQQATGPSATEQSTGGQAAGSSARTANANSRVRTLADQRRDEDEEHRRRGTQLYNGMGLNVQPRKDDEDGNREK